MRSTWPVTLAIAALVVFAWELVERIVGARFPVVPAPSAIAEVLVSRALPIWLNFRLTLAEAAVGFVAGSLAGLGIAAIFVRWPILERALYNLFVTVHSIPLVAIAPLLILWFGAGPVPPTLIAAMACFFPMAINATRGLRAVAAPTLQLMTALDADERQVLLRVRLPASLPFVLAALKAGAPAAVLGATVGEWLGTAGLGYLLFSSMVGFQVPMLWATMLVSTALALAGYVAFGWLERRLAGWHASVRAQESR